MTDPDEWPLAGVPSPRQLLWAVTDARDCAQSFRLALENDRIEHEVFQINASDTSSLLETGELIARYYPNVPLKSPQEDLPLWSPTRRRPGFSDINLSTPGVKATSGPGWTAKTTAE